MGKDPKVVGRTRHRGGRNLMYKIAKERHKKRLDLRDTGMIKGLHGKIIVEENMKEDGMSTFVNF